MSEGCTAKSSLDPELEKDVARWNALPLAQFEYQQPPQGWHFVESDIVHIRFSLPCEPEFKREINEDLWAFHYWCTIGKRYYSLYAFPTNDVRVPEFRDAFFRSHIDGVIRGLEKRGAPGIFKPVCRVSYQGAIGRQSILNVATTQFEMRILPGSNAMISMQVIDLTSNQPGDSARYFNSLNLL